MGDVLRRVGHAGETVGVVISVRGDFSVLVGDGRTAPTRVIGEADRGRVRIGDAGEAVPKVVSESCAVLLGVDHGGARTKDLLRRRGLNDENLLSPCVSGKVFSLEIPFYRTRTSPPKSIPQIQTSS
jgi:hypothetical protein